jgi:hypothetical protein
MPPCVNDPVIRGISERISGLTMTPQNNAEYMQARAGVRGRARARARVGVRGRARVGVRVRGRVGVRGRGRGRPTPSTCRWCGTRCASST